MEKGTLCRGKVQGWRVSVGWTHLVQREVAREAGSGTVSLDLLHLGLPCGGRLQKEGVAWKAPGRRSSWQRPQSQILALLSSFSIVHRSVSKSSSSHKNVLGLSCLSKKRAWLAG